LVVGIDAASTSEDEDDADLDAAEDTQLAALSQIATLATGDKQSKKPQHKHLPPAQSAVAAILASAGVSYTHENSEVIGSSKVEAQISRKALQAAEDSQISEVPAFAGGGAEGVRYNPPEEVRRRQFCEAARVLGFGEGREAVRNFALVVEGWTQKRRREVLERFYEARAREVQAAMGHADGVGMEEAENEAGKQTELVVKQEKEPSPFREMGGETIELSSDDEL
jgi:hypothetical protein